MVQMTEPDLNDFRLFVHVVDAGGFSAAARRLGIPRSRVSRRIAQMEEQLDVRLIQGVNPGVPVDKEADEHARAANAACLEAAKRLIFDPARTSAGTRVRVWQGVAFFLD